MEFSFKYMCRTCMNEEETIYSIFTSENVVSNICYADMLMACTSLHIEENDDLPKNICHHCLKQLLTAHSFKQKCERSEAMLKEITKNPHIEFIKEEITNDFQETIDNLTQYTQNTIDNLTEDTQHTIDNLTEDTQRTVDNLTVDIQVIKKEEISEPEINDYDTENCRKIVSRPKITSSLTRLENNTKKSNPLECLPCQRIFLTSQSYKRHKKIHIRKLKCEICLKDFRSYHGLRYHMKIHNGIKNFPCTFENCTKRFRLKQALNKHLSIHNNEKNHLCSLCGKTYSTYDAWHYHIRAHRGDRPYLCIHCGKTFKQSCHLKSHMWVHSGIKPHCCNLCGKSYTSGHQLKKHAKKHCETT